MRVALAGKGGAGKTTISATLARVAAERGMPVVCIDADSNPNLAVALGYDADLVLPAPLPFDIVSRKLDGPALTEPVEAVLDAHTVAGPAGIRLGVMGMPAHAEEGCMCTAHAAVRAILADLGAAPERLTILDLEASPEHFGRGTTRHVDVLLLIAEPYYRSLETVRRMAELAGELPIARVGVVANKIRDEGGREAIAEFCARHGLELMAQLPWSDDALDADRDRVPLAQRHPDGPVARAVGDLLTSLLAITPAPVAGSGVA